MASKIMQFSTLDGDRVKVTFTGDAVSEGTLIPGEDPVRIQMDGGGRDYEAVKYATATITCIADGLQLQDLFTDSINVRVSVVNETTGKTLFLGAVSPNTFAQTLTGYNDELSIECVDMLGAAKFVPYAKLNGDSAAFCAMTIAEAVLHIASILGLQRVWFADSVSVQPRHGEYSTTSYEKLTIAEQYFYENTTPELVHKDSGAEVTYAPLAMSCYGALSMLAESLYMTFAQVGEDLYLHDYMPLRADSQVTYKEILSTGLGADRLTVSATELTEESFDAGATQISVLPRYSLFSVEHKTAEEVNLLPDAFQHELYTEVSTGATSAESTRDAEKLYIKIFDAPIIPYVNITADLEAMMLASVEVKKPDIAEFDTTGYWRKKVFDNDWKLDFYMLNVYTATAPLLKYRAQYNLAIPARYQWRLRLGIEIGFSRERAVYPAPEKTNNHELAVQIICDGLYYNEVTQAWGTAEHNVILEFPSGDEWRKIFKFKNAQYAVAAADIIAPVGNPGTIELRVMGFGDVLATHWVTAWIRSLSLSIVEPHEYRRLNKIDPLPEREYRGAWSADRELDAVSFPIQIEPTLAEKSFGTLIDGIEYCDEEDLNHAGTTRAAAEFRYLADGQKYTMLQRIEQLANSEDNYELILPLRDENNAVEAVGAFTSTLWSGVKAVVAYERDIKNNAITVTVN